MIRRFCLILGATLCLRGCAGVALDFAAQPPNTSPYDALCLITGILALMTVVESRRLARGLCAGIGAVHGAIVVVNIALLDNLASRGLGVGSFDLWLSATVAMSCLFASSHVTPSRRFWIGPRFDDRLAAPDRPYLTIEK